MSDLLKPDIILGEPVALYEEDYHEYTFYSPDGIAITRVAFDYIENEGSGKLWTELSVWWLLGQPDSDAIFGPMRVNLLAPDSTWNGANGVVGKLSRIIEATVNWERTFDSIKRQSILEYRRSSSSGGFLEWVEPDDSESPFLYRPWISRSGVTLFYAPGGSNKSMIALALGLSIATGKPIIGNAPEMTGRVLYVDFEDDAEPHAHRLTAFARSVGMTAEDVEGKIYHERVTGSLRDSIRRIRNTARDIEAVLVIVDSVGLARAGAVADSEATIKLFKAFNSIGIPVLAIDHMTKEDEKKINTGSMDPRQAMAIGSVYSMSSTRLAWFFQLLPDSTETTKVFNVHNTKHNHVPTQPSIGMKFRIESNENDIPVRATFSRASSRPP